MSKRMFILVVILALCATPTIAYGASPWTEEEGYVNRANAKFGFGLKNAALGWTEIFTQPVDETREGGNAFVGFGRGIWNTVGQTAGGAFHLGTFLFTHIDVPLPENGNQLFNQ
ncbi:MAG: hypothetical protein IH968_03605 [Gemmatimonadetes bacterium]|nr:hypothetical protein [Gemmatimonadota bacterium]